MTTTLADKPAIWQCRNDTAPADFAALYRHAAQLIRARGYDPYDDYADAAGISIGTALRKAAEAYDANIRPAGSLPGRDEACIADLTEELETRLAGVMYVTGQAFYRTGIRDLSDTVAGWERTSIRVYASTRYRSRTQAEASAVLEVAASMLTTIPADGTR
jgi:hypothetical protein